MNIPQLTALCLRYQGVLLDASEEVVHVAVVDAPSHELLDALHFATTKRIEITCWTRQQMEGHASRTQQTLPVAVQEKHQPKAFPRQRSCRFRGRWISRKMLALFRERRMRSLSLGQRPFQHRREAHRKRTSSGATRHLPLIAVAPLRLRAGATSPGESYGFQPGAAGASAKRSSAGAL